MRSLLGRTVATSLCAVAMTLPACHAPAHLERHVIQMRDDAQAARDDLRAQADRLEALRRAQPDQTPEQAQLDALIAATRAKIGALDAAVAQAEAVLREASGPTSPLSATARGLGSMLPEPARAPLVLGAALLVTLARARQLKVGAASIAASVSKAMDADPKLRAAFQRQANTMRSIQTPTAKRIVDEAIGQRRPVLPV